MLGADALPTHATHPHLQAHASTPARAQAQAPANAHAPAQPASADAKPSEANSGHRAVALVPRVAPREPQVLAHSLQRAYPVQASFTLVKDAAPAVSASAAAPASRSSSQSPLSSLHHAQSNPSAHPLTPLVPLAPLSLGRPPSLLPFPSSSSLSAGLDSGGNDDVCPASPSHPHTATALPPQEQQDLRDKEVLQDRDVWYLSGPPEAVTQARTALLRDAPQSASTTLRVPTHLLYPPPLEPGTEAEPQALRATIQERIDTITHATGTTIRISNPVARDADVAAISQAESETFAELAITGSHDTVALAQIRLLVLSDQLVRLFTPRFSASTCFLFLLGSCFCLRE